MDALKIALLQALPSGWDQQANLIKGECLCRMAQELGADIALFPEMWNIGYQFPDSLDERSKDEWRKQAIAVDSDFIQYYCKLACELKMAIAITYLEEWDEAPRNTASLIDRHGNIVLTYAKVHPCEFADEAALTPGDGFRVCALRMYDGMLCPWWSFNGNPATGASEVEVHKE